MIVDAGWIFACRFTQCKEDAPQAFFPFETESAHFLDTAQIIAFEPFIKAPDISNIMTPLNRTIG
jgi:hypothetical protein